MNRPFEKELQEFIEKYEQPMYIELNNIILEYRKDIPTRNSLLRDFLNKYRKQLSKVEILELEAKLQEH